MIFVPGGHNNGLRGYERGLLEENTTPLAQVVDLGIRTRSIKSAART